jgi:hypothetical protein
MSSGTISSFITNENKALLWSVLHGSGKFTGIPDKHLHNVKEMFEITIREMSEHYRKINQPIDLNNMNKEAVVVICKKIETVKQHFQPQAQPQTQPQTQTQIQHNFSNQNHHTQQNYQKKQQQIPQLETIYKAEDLQKERQNIFQNEFKKKEEEMSSILKLKKPEEINFTDDVYDKPIGDDMERLLAEALASRERELEQIKNVSFTMPPPTAVSTTLKPITTTSTPEPIISSSNQDFITYKMVRDKDGNDKHTKENEKRVSFGSELRIIENNQNDNEMNNNENSDENGDISFIFNKLKKIKTTNKNQYDNYDNHNQYFSNVNLDANNNNSNSNNNNSNSNSNNNNSNNNSNNNNNDRIILHLSEDIKSIKNTLAELMEKINKIYHESGMNSSSTNLLQ